MDLTNQQARAIVDAARVELQQRRVQCQALRDDEFVHMDAREFSSLLIARMAELSAQIRKMPERVELVDRYTVTHQTLRDTMRCLTPFEPISFGSSDLLSIVGSSAEDA